MLSEMMSSTYVIRPGVALADDPRASNSIPEVSDQRPCVSQKGQPCHFGQYDSSLSNIYQMFWVCPVHSEHEHYEVLVHQVPAASSSHCDRLKPPLTFPNVSEMDSILNGKLLD